jgi:hypothetical protein
VGTPAASDLTLAPGAGHGDEGDASFQGPAQEEVLSAQPKPTHSEANMASSVIELTARIAKPETNETARRTQGFVTVRPKPEKRLNAKERLKARRQKDNPAAAEATAVTPEASGLSTAHPKPEKRKNAKERAKERYTKNSTEGGTTPDTTAKAKSKVETKKAKKAKSSKAARAA